MMMRRHFIFNVLVAAIGTFLKACAGISSAGIESGVMFKFSEYPDLLNVGGVAEIRMLDKDFVVTRTSADTLSALSNKCTHRGCTLNFFNRSGFECPCHGSGFDLQGNVVRGPALRPLEKLASRIDTENGVFILF